MNGGAAGLTELFSKLSPTQKAMFLARVAHEATIAARMSYVPTASDPERNFENPDGRVLRDANNFVHRVTGFLMHVLDRSEDEGQDGFVMAMIAEHFDLRHLSNWLAESKKA